MRVHYRWRAWLLAAPLLLASAALARDVEPLALATGTPTGTYIAIGRDLARLGKQAGVPVAVQESGGSIDNIKRLNRHDKSGAQLGIVQSDVLGFLARSQNPGTKKMAARLRLILPLYREEVQVLARGDIHDFKDLQGKRVVVGEDGSGHMLTAINLLSMMDISPAELIKKSAPEGVLALLSGEADAMIYVGGKPVKLFKNLESLPTQDSGKYAGLLGKLHFLPLDDPKMLEEYAPAVIAPQDYSFVPASVPTVAVTAVLIDDDYSGKSKADVARCREIHTLMQAVRMHLIELKEHGHPKWKEVSLEAELSGWPKDKCAWEGPAEKPEKKEKKQAHHASHAKPAKASPARYVIPRDPSAQDR